MLCKCHWIVLYTVHFTAFCLGGPFFPGHGVVTIDVSSTGEENISESPSLLGPTACAGPLHCTVCSGGSYTLNITGSRSSTERFPKQLRCALSINAGL